MACQLVCVPPDEAVRTWPHVRDLIFAAMKRGDLGSFRPVEASVLGGEALLWLAIARAGDDGARIQAAAVTELHQSEWRKVCVVVACGGAERARWIALLDQLPVGQKFDSLQEVWGALGRHYEGRRF